MVGSTSEMKVSGQSQKVPDVGLEHPGGESGVGAGGGDPLWKVGRFGLL